VLKGGSLFRRRGPRPSSGAAVFTAWMSEEYAVELPLDDVGLERADELADRLKYTGGDRRRDAEAGLAAFVAEVLRRRHGGRWDPEVGTLTIPNGTALNVRAWAAKRLHYGREDSLVFKARAAAELANPTPEPDWDPAWPEDGEAASDFAGSLDIDPAQRQQVDGLLTEWLTLRKTTYLDLRANAGRREDDGLETARVALRSLSSAQGSGAYALARRHKAHAWVQHWRFGRSLSGPSSYLVERSERPTNELVPADFVAFVRYLAPTPQFRDHALLDMVWRVEKSSEFRRSAGADQRRLVAMDLLRLVLDAHPWTATPHIKRLLAFMETADPAMMEVLRGARSEAWPDFWVVVKRIILSGTESIGAADLRFGADVLTWLDGARGAAPDGNWAPRRDALVSKDKAAIDRLTAWLDGEGASLRRYGPTGEVVPPIARWVKSARWYVGAL
jgi:hypothetical protein